MEDSGLAYDHAMRTLQSSSSSEAAKRAEGTAQMVSKGMNLAEAGRRCGLFTEFEAKLIDTALRAGSPARIYRRLAEHYAAKADNLRTIKAQMALPAAILMLCILLPLLQAINIGIDVGAKSNWARLLIAVIEIGVILYVVVRAPIWWRNASGTRFRATIERMFCRLPLFGKVQVRRNLRDFTESLALLLDAGLPMAEAVPLALGVMQNDIVRDAFDPVMPLLKKGRALSDGLQRIPIIRKSSLLALAHTGETSGKLPEMLFRFAQHEAEAIAFFDRQVAIWLPRIAYTLLGLWMIFALLAAHTSFFSRAID